ncbi:hypothetical protein HYX06_03590 [Candidatus Woesearchaeota archaeon]|nr:hypothetical protein [Candidatus Woesearchaeota archaeon]
MYSRNLMAAGLAALCLSSAACASAPAKENPVMGPREARISLQKRIDEFMANRDLINVQMMAQNITANHDIMYIPLYDGPAKDMPRLEELLLSAGVFRKTSVNGSPFASVGLDQPYRDVKISIDYFGADGEHLKLPLGYAELSGLANSVR